jgi:hypothetical protein
MLYQDNRCFWFIWWVVAVRACTTSLY